MIPTDDSLGWPWRYSDPDGAGTYDELFDPAGRPRADWEPLVSKLRALGLEELRRRWEEARRLLHEHGVSYDVHGVHGDGEGAARPWNLSPIPVVFGPDTWGPLDAGLSQRARLLDLVLADLYGPQRLLSEGLLPPDLLFGHAGFLRPCAGIVPPLGRFLPLYSADVVRGRDGRFAVLADRPQSPSGVGYALENRIVLSRSLPEVFRDCGVERLAAFFRTTRNLLHEVAPRARDNPLVVLLTPGPYSATYFEQAFLAQYLALTLVRGEDLALPSVPTYWCGDPGALSLVLSRLSELVIKPAYPQGPPEPIVGHGLSSDALADLAARLRAAPRRYVAQERVDLSVVPSLSGDELSRSRFWMRTYAVASGDGYEVMPGALSRVGGQAERFVLSLEPGGESKDTWVLADGPVQPLSLLPPPSAPVEISRDESDLPSRIADNLFWLGRYVERAEGTARLMRAVAARLSDPNGASDSDLAADVDPLLCMLEAQTYVRRQLPVERDAQRERGAWPGEAERWLLGAVFDSEPSGTLRATLAETYRVARSLRDWLSPDAWRAVAHLDQELRRPYATSEPSTPRALIELLNRVVALLAALEGLLTESMTHDQAWRFLDIGRRLERCSLVVGLLRSSLGAPSAREGPVLEALLEITASSTTYRRRYLATLQAPPVVDLLLCDETNPRSALFQLEALAAHVQALPRSTRTTRTPQEKLVLSALTELRIVDVPDLCDVVEPRERRRLVSLLDRVAAHLPAVSNALAASYFNHAALSS